MNQAVFFLSNLNTLLSMMDVLCIATTIHKAFVSNML